MGLNRWLEETYGKTVDGKPLFRLVWSDEQFEHRLGTFRDFYGDILVREVTEVRYTLKYPFIDPPTWVLEKIYPVTPEAVNAGLVATKESWEMIYAFQDKEGNPLPLAREMLEAALYLFFKFYIQTTPKDRLDYRYQRLAERDKELKQQNKDRIGDNLRSPLFLVTE